MNTKVWALCIWGDLNKHTFQITRFKGVLPIKKVFKLGEGGGKRLFLWGPVPPLYNTWSEDKISKVKN